MAKGDPLESYGWTLGRAKVGWLEEATTEFQCDSPSKNRAPPAAPSPPLSPPNNPLHHVSPATLEDSTHSDLSLCRLDMFLGPSSPLQTSVFLAPFKFLSSVCTTTVFPHATVRTKLPLLLPPLSDWY